jgi:hypothetical protein
MMMVIDWVRVKTTLIALAFSLLLWGVVGSLAYSLLQ